MMEEIAWCHAIKPGSFASSSTRLSSPAGLTGWAVWAGWQPTIVTFTSQAFLPWMNEYVRFVYALLSSHSSSVLYLRLDRLIYEYIYYTENYSKLKRFPYITYTIVNGTYGENPRRGLAGFFVVYFPFPLKHGEFRLKWTFKKLHCNGVQELQNAN